MRTACTNKKFGGAQWFFDKVTGETISLAKPLIFDSHFSGADLVIPDQSAPESGQPWVKKIVGAAPPTVAKTANGTGGLVACSLTSDAQKQDGALYHGDQLTASIAQGAVMEIRAALTTLPTLNGLCQMGFYGAWADGGSAYRVGFEIPAAGAVTCESDDNATDTAALAGVTLVAGEYHIFRIDCTDQSAIRFTIDLADVATGTTFANAASAANSKAQPHTGMYKASGAGLGVLSVDRVRVWQDNE